MFVICTHLRAPGKRQAPPGTCHCSTYPAPGAKIAPLGILGRPLRSVGCRTQGDPTGHFSSSPAWLPAGRVRPRSAPLLAGLGAGFRTGLKARDRPLLGFTTQGRPFESLRATAQDDPPLHPEVSGLRGAGSRY